MNVHSIRSLGKERLDFGDRHNEGDLSYIEVKVRSLIMGETEVGLGYQGQVEGE